MENQLSVKFLKVLYGDAIYIRYYGNDGIFHNIFIDSGFGSTYESTIKKEVNSIIENNEIIDLFVITHIDQDHIGGILKFIKDFGNKEIAREIWFNAASFVNINVEEDGKISFSQGVKLRDYLIKNYELREDIVCTGGVLLTIYGAEFDILTPDKDTLEMFIEKWNGYEVGRYGDGEISSERDDYDKSIEELAKIEFVEDGRIENKVSISFIYKSNGQSILFLGDSHPSTVVTALIKRGYSSEKKLQVDCVKISHHSSKANTSYELLSLIESNVYVICANAKNRYYFPHKETLARILSNPKRDVSQKIKLVFNYDNDEIRSIFCNADYEIYNFECLYPEDNENGYNLKF